MNFKEALIAHFRGENVQVREYVVWKDFKDWISDIEREFAANNTQFRIKPRTICANGVEVPAPENVAPERGSVYFIPDPEGDAFCSKVTWKDQLLDNYLLSRGLVYLRKEDAIARAKAMLLTQE